MARAHVSFSWTSGRPEVRALHERTQVGGTTKVDDNTIAKTSIRVGSPPDGDVDVDAPIASEQREGVRRGEDTFRSSCFLFFTASYETNRSPKTRNFHFRKARQLWTTRRRFQRRLDGRTRGRRRGENDEMDPRFPYIPVVSDRVRGRDSDAAPRYRISVGCVDISGSGPEETIQRRRFWVLTFSIDNVVVVVVSGWDAGLRGFAGVRAVHCPSLPAEPTRWFN